MIYRFLGAIALATTAFLAAADAAHGQSPAGQRLRYPHATAFDGVDILAAAVDQGEIIWAIDDGHSVPSAFNDGPRQPSAYQLVQAQEPAAPGAPEAPEGPDAGADQTPDQPDQPEPDNQPDPPQNDTPPPAAGAATAYGALGTTSPDGTTSSVAGAAPSEGDADASAIRAQRDAATLLEVAPGVAVNAHSPMMHETALRGRRLGQVPAKGSYWFPARQDLDTMMSKIDSQLVDRITTINGPYSALYGPGLAFYNVELLRAPQYDVGNGFETHSQTVGQYETNGEQFLGRQAFWGGDETWGFRGGYSHRGGSDYESGGGVEFPASYKSRQADLALGAWLTPDSRIDFQYLRLDQTDVEIPGQFFDINALVTDAFDGTYSLFNQPYFDSLIVDAWYNRTNFYGDNLRPGKRRTLPNLDQDLPSPAGQQDSVHFRSFTNVMAHSSGFTSAFGWGDVDAERLTAGFDLRYLGQRIDELNTVDFETQQLDPQGNPVGPPVIDTIISVSNPQPRGHSSNPGVFVEYQQPVADELKVRTGGRFDWVSMNALETLPAVNPITPPVNAAQDLGGPFDQEFNLGSGFITIDLQATDVVSFNAGCGYAMRPPTMTEMYADGPFIAVLPQNIQTSLFGDPLLDPERQVQVDVGVTTQQDYLRSGARGYHAWVQDYITLDLLSNSAYAYVNTPHATLAGCEAFGECDLLPRVTAFGIMNFVEGRDESRTSTISRQRQLQDPGAQPDERSIPLVGPVGTPGNAHENLPVIAPLFSRLGCRLHSDEENSPWTVEICANVVNDQDNVATSLRELTTPGYSTYDILCYQRMTDSLTLTGGVRNFTDKNYQTYFDTRQAGNAPVVPLFQPGINFFFGAEYTR